MDYLKDYPDNHFSLSICDPPYGLGKRIVDGGSISPLIKSQKGIVKKWDKKPNSKYLIKVAFTPVIDYWEKIKNEFGEIEFHPLGGLTIGYNF